MLRKWNVKPHEVDPIVVFIQRLRHLRMKPATKRALKVGELDDVDFSRNPEARNFRRDRGRRLNDGPYRRHQKRQRGRRWPQPALARRIDVDVGMTVAD